MSARRLALSSEYVDALVSSSVSACALRVALLVARMQGRNEHAWPTVEGMRARIGCDKRTVQRAVAELVRAGLLATEERRGGRTFYSTLTPGVDATPGAAVTGDEPAAAGAGAAPGVDATATGGVSIPPPQAWTPPAGGVSIHSHLTQEDDQRSLIRGTGNAPAHDLTRRVESERAAFVSSFRAGGKTPSPWMLGFGTRDWIELDAWLTSVAAGREADTAAQLGRGFAKSSFAEQRGFRFRGPGGLIEGPGEFLSLGGQVAPSVVEHTATTDEEFEKAMAGT